MALPTYRGVATAQGSSTSGSVNVATIDSGVPPTNGDLLLAHVARLTASTAFDQHINAPAGWHRLGGQQFGLVSAIFWKIRQAGDSNTVAFTWAVSNDYIAAIHCIRGADQSRPICRTTARALVTGTWSWQSVDTPVIECLAVATAACAQYRASGATGSTNWTERVQAGQGGMGMYCLTRDFAVVGSTGSAAPGAASPFTNADSIHHMFVIQPPQLATPKDIRVATGTLTSPTATGDQDITGLGFAVKALIVYGMRQNADAVSANLEYMHGIGADDGVTTAAQFCCGIWYDGVEAGWSRNGEIVAAYFAGNSTLASPDLLATYSRITGGFRLNWTAVQASGYDFNYIALGGDDLRAIGGSKAGGTSVFTLPWRSDVIHVCGQCLNSNVDQIRRDVGVGTLSVGWIDTNTGAQWAALQNTDGSAVVRDDVFYGQTADTVLSYGLRFLDVTTTGWRWTESNADFFFYLALYLGGGGTDFPVQVEVQRSDASGAPGAAQVMPSFGLGQSLTTKKLVSSIIGRPGTEIAAGASRLGEGHVKFNYGVVDQGGFAYGRGATNERRRKLGSAFLQATTTGDLDAPAKVGTWQNDRETIVWNTNDSTGYLMGLFTLGFIGQVYARDATDAVDVTDSTAVVLVRGAVVRVAIDVAAVTDQIRRATASVRIVSDTLSVPDLIRRTATYGRRVVDTSVVTDLIRRTVTYGRRVIDTNIVTDLIRRTATYGRRVNDTASATDQLRRTTAYDRRVADTASVTDQLGRTTAHGRRVDDTSAVVDGAGRTAIYGRPIIDTSGVADVIAATRATVVSDIAAAGDLIRRTAVYGRRVTDAVTTADVLGRAATYGRRVVDTALITEFVTRATTIAVSVSDIAAVVDLIRRTAVYGRHAIDTAMVTDSVAATRARVVSDIATVSDLIRRTTAYGLRVIDTTTVTEQIGRTVAYGRRVIDSAPITELIGRTIVYGRRVIDTTVVADLIGRTTTYGRRVIDIAPAVDQFERTTAYARRVLDAVPVLDQIERTTTFETSIGDMAAVTDQGVRTTAYGRTVVDTVTATDPIGSSIAYAVPISDTVDVTDRSARSAVYGRRRIVDTIAVTDRIGRALTWYGRTVGNDAVAVEDSISTVDGKVRFVLHGIRNGANVGPVSMSGGSGFITGPRRLIANATDTITITDLVEATG